MAQVVKKILAVANIKDLDNNLLANVARAIAKSVVTRQITRFVFNYWRYYCNHHMVSGTTP